MITTEDINDLTATTYELHDDCPCRIIEIRYKGQVIKEIQIGVNWNSGKYTKEYIPQHNCQIKPKEFEYKTIVVYACFVPRTYNTYEWVYSDSALGIKTGSPSKFLEQESEHGWELVTMSTMDEHREQYVFKREKQ